MPKVDEWIFADNSGESYQIIADGNKYDYKIWVENIWKIIEEKYSE